MIIVHHARRARSVRLLWLLEELGVPYESRLIELNREGTRNPEYMKLHPLGQVPVLQDGDITMFESGAIVEYLLERYGEGRLMPAASAGWDVRAHYLQWCHFGEASLAKHLAAIVYHRFGKESERIPAALDQARKRFGEALVVVERALEGRSYLCGAELSAADIMISYPITVGKIMAELPPDVPNVVAYLDQLKQRPAYAKAWA